MVMEKSSEKLRSHKNEKLDFFSATVKVTAHDKFLLDQVFSFLQIGFVCTVTSPLMYAEGQDAFYRYANLALKETPTPTSKKQNDGEKPNGR